jgi:hypothetical protein
MYVKHHSFIIFCSKNEKEKKSKTFLRPFISVSTFEMCSGREKNESKTGR